MSSYRSCKIRVSQRRRSTEGRFPEREEHRGEKGKKKIPAHGFATTLLNHQGADSQMAYAGKYRTSQWSYVKRYHSTALSGELRVNKQEQIPNICENTSCYCLHMFKHFSGRYIWTALPTHCHSLPPVPHSPHTLQLFRPPSNQFRKE